MEGLPKAEQADFVKHVQQCKKYVLFCCKRWWKQEEEEILSKDMGDGLLESEEEEMSISWRIRKLVTYYCMRYSIFS